eukprot:scaffold23810_cov30-Attheya_sp.AAC.1
MAFFVTIGIVALSLSRHVSAQSLEPSANCTGAGADLSGWSDAFGDTCQDYTDNTTLCTLFGNTGGGSGFEDITANEACISCGACDTCDDFVGFVDDNGVIDLTCTDYANDTLFDEYYPDNPPEYYSDDS